MPRQRCPCEAFTLARAVTRRSPPAPRDVSVLRGYTRRRLLLRAIAAAAAAAFFCTMPASATRDGLAGPTRPGKLKTPQCTKTTSVSLAGAIHNASAGATICLRSGSYDAVRLRSLSKSSDVTVRPAAGANVTIGSVNLQVVSRLRFTGLGGTMSVNGVEIDRSDTRPNCSRHLTFDHLKFTTGMDILPRCANMAIRVDHANLNNLTNTGVGDGRLNVQAMDVGPNADQGITISNSTFNGGCSKGMQILGGAYGVRVLNNEFAHLPDQDRCVIHIGDIQIYGGSHTRLIGNYFHDNGSSAGGVSMPDSDNTLVQNNVWVCTCIYPWSVQAGATRNSRFLHNTFAGGGGLHFYLVNGNTAAGNLIRDNVFTDAGNGITWDRSSSAWGTNDHNLNAGVRGPANLRGKPVFVGGKKPQSYSGYRLARGSRGKGAASDGGDLGIRTTATACKRGSVAAQVGGKRVCLRAGKRCEKRYDRQYRKHGFRCVKGRLRKLPKHAPS